MQVAENAVKQIKKMVASQRQLVDDNDYVPVVVWIFDRHGDEPGPVLGLIDRYRIEGMVTDCYSEGQEFIVYNGLPDDLREKFQNHTLEFNGKDFDFIPVQSVGETN